MGIINFDLGKTFEQTHTVDGNYIYFLSGEGAIDVQYESTFNDKFTLTKKKFISRGFKQVIFSNSTIQAGKTAQLFIGSQADAVTIGDDEGALDINTITSVDVITNVDNITSVDNIDSVDLIDELTLVKNIESIEKTNAITTGAIAVTATAVKILDAKATRKKVTLINDGLQKCYIGGVGTITNANGFVMFITTDTNGLPPLIINNWVGELWAVCAAGQTTTLRFMEEG